LYKIDDWEEGERRVLITYLTDRSYIMVMIAQLWKPINNQFVTAFMYLLAGSQKDKIAKICGTSGDKLDALPNANVALFHLPENFAI
jgi:hypothetical protein